MPRSRDALAFLIARLSSVLYSPPQRVQHNTMLSLVPTPPYATRPTPSNSQTSSRHCYSNSECSADSAACAWADANMESTRPSCCCARACVYRWMMATNAAHFPKQSLRTLQELSHWHLTIHPTTYRSATAIERSHLPSAFTDIGATPFAR